MDSISEFHFVEVDEKPDRHIQQLHVTHKLGFVDRENGLHRFGFNQNTLINQQIEAEWFFTSKAFVRDGDLLLGNGRQTSQFKFFGETPFVNRFHQPRPLVAMDLNRCADYRLG